MDTISFLVLGALSFLVQLFSLLTNLLPTLVACKRILVPPRIGVSRPRISASLDSSNRLLVIASLTHVLLILFPAPLSMLSYFRKGMWYGGHVTCIIYRFLVCFSQIVHLLMIFLLAGERCIIARKYCSDSGHKNVLETWCCCYRYQTLLLVLCIFSISCFLCIIPFFGFGLPLPSSDTEKCSSWFYSIVPSYVDTPFNKHSVFTLCFIIVGAISMVGVLVLAVAATLPYLVARTTPRVYHFTKLVECDSCTGKGRETRFCLDEANSPECALQLNNFNGPCNEPSNQRPSSECSCAGHSSTGTRQVVEGMQAAKVVASLAVLVNVTWLPSIVLLTFTLAVHPLPIVIIESSFILTYFCPLFLPLIYAIFTPYYHRTYRKICQEFFTHLCGCPDVYDGSDNGAVTLSPTIRPSNDQTTSMAEENLENDNHDEASYYSNDTDRQSSCRSELLRSQKAHGKGQIDDDESIGRLQYNLPPESGVGMVDVDGYESVRIGDRRDNSYENSSSSLTTTLLLSQNAERKKKTGKRNRRPRCQKHDRLSSPV